MGNISLDEGIRELIYTRTGYLFLEKKSGASNIIPRNLRGNINLISLLTSMPRIKFSLREKVLRVTELLGIEESVGKNILNKLNGAKDFNNEEKEFLYEIELIDEENFEATKLKKKIIVLLKKIGLEEKVFIFENEFEKNKSSLELTHWEINDKNDENNLQNRGLFKNFFFKSWINEILNTEQREILKELFERNTVEKNKYIVNYLIKKYEIINRIKENKENSLISSTTTWTDVKNRKLEEILIISSEENNPLNISLGDLLYVLDKIKLYEDSKDFEMFSFAIKTIYSIFLYDFYKDDEEISWNSNYMELIGGSLLNPYHKDIMKYSSSKLKRHNLDINYKFLKNQIKNQNVKSKINDLSFFILRMLKNTHSTESREKYRQNDEKYYIYNPSSNLLKANFDVFQFFINIELKKEIWGSEGKNFNSKVYIGNIDVLEVVTNSLVKLKKSGSSYGIVFKNYIENLNNIELLNNIKYIRLKENEYINELSKILNEIDDFEIDNFFDALTYSGDSELDPLIKELNNSITSIETKQRQAKKLNDKIEKKLIFIKNRKEKSLTHTHDFFLETIDKLAEVQKELSYIYENLNLTSNNFQNLLEILDSTPNFYLTAQNEFMNSIDHLSQNNLALLKLEKLFKRIVGSFHRTLKELDQEKKSILIKKYNNIASENVFSKTKILNKLEASLELSKEIGIDITEEVNELGYEFNHKFNSKDSRGTQIALARDITKRCQGLLREKIEELLGIKNNG